MLTFGNVFCVNGGLNSGTITRTVHSEHIPTLALTHTLVFHSNKGSQVFN